VSRELVLGSVVRGARLKFLEFEGGSGECSVHYECENFSARTRLRTLYNPGNDLQAFFSRMAESWRGWSGDISWIAWENDFSLTASHDGRGHVVIQVHIGQMDPVDCTLQGKLVLEAGELDNVVAQVKRFLS
jgi:Family of unknown function (DUF6228)